MIQPPYHGEVGNLVCNAGATKLTPRRKPQSEGRSRVKNAQQLGHLPVTQAPMASLQKTLQSLYALYQRIGGFLLEKFLARSKIRGGFDAKYVWVRRHEF